VIVKRRLTALHPEKHVITVTTRINDNAACLGEQVARTFVLSLLGMIYTCFALCINGRGLC
jgi:hypothetical protein